MKGFIGQQKYNLVPTEVRCVPDLYAQCRSLTPYHCKGPVTTYQCFVIRITIAEYKTQQVNINKVIIKREDQKELISTHHHYVGAVCCSKPRTVMSSISNCHNFGSSCFTFLQFNYDINLIMCVYAVLLVGYFKIQTFKNGKRTTF